MEPELELTPASEFPDSWILDENPYHRAGHAALEGKPMPPLVELSGWINGEVEPADLKGKVVIVELYTTASWPSRRTFSLNNKLLKQYKDKGLMIVGVCTSSSGQEEMAALAKEKGVEYPTARDPTLKTKQAWRAYYYPTYAVVDRKGIVRVVGLRPACLEKVVEKLLAEPAPGDVALPNPK